MNNTIKVRVKNVYGNDLTCVVDNEQAEAIKLLTGQKTLTENSVKGLKMLGFKFERVI